ncbi:hypothetical protein AMAG_01232 [Allomyces macrogynus ATCC 38327]|uniref:BZIP domain-containing protein n=1 Tax=Allomyces macrogynus (strain ATCC 38327) TaxID=578462 RepID=A0A0L0RYU8_ALLM3|nr:hypothetical protein AMAG_01232 [Allomyces macrogynus ATCC 38327]|eukprot:KNE55330.1 hypothetical protein AMAG_01232 [Allomyces macrogynus ATCC 38327]
MIKTTPTTTTTLATATSTALAAAATMPTLPPAPALPAPPAAHDAWQWSPPATYAPPRHHPHRHHVPPPPHHAHHPHTHHARTAAWPYPPPPPLPAYAYGHPPPVRHLPPPPPHGYDHDPVAHLQQVQQHATAMLSHAWPPGAADPTAAAAAAAAGVPASPPHRYPEPAAAWGAAGGARGGSGSGGGLYGGAPNAGPLPPHERTDVARHEWSAAADHTVHHAAVPPGMQFEFERDVRHSPPMAETTTASPAAEGGVVAAAGAVPALPSPTPLPPGSGGSTSTAASARAATTTAGSKPKLSAAEKLAIKRQRNTEAARRSRLRKMQRMEELEVRVIELEDQARELLLERAVHESDRQMWAAKENEYRAKIAALEERLLASVDAAAAVGAATAGGLEPTAWMGGEDAQGPLPPPAQVPGQPQRQQRQQRQDESHTPTAVVPNEEAAVPATGRGASTGRRARHRAQLPTSPRTSRCV